MFKYMWKFTVSAPAVALALSAPAFAQTQSSDNGPTDAEIVVTGTYIQGTAKDTAIPVSVVTQEDIEKRGSPSVLDLIKTLPIAGPALGDTNQFNATANVRNGGGTINIRSLGWQRTLVLLNGRRFAAGTADTNLLPIAAIGRVEVLKDGAAATYGSDAIAGVANFITRKNVDGLEASVDYRHVPGSDGGDYTGSLLFGHDGDGVNFLLSAAYQHRAELSVLKRDWVLQPYLTSPAGWSGTGNPGAYTAYSGPNGTGTSYGYNIDANCTAVGGYSGFAGVSPVCYYQYMPFVNLIENTDQYQLYGELNFEIADNIEFHIEGLYANTKLPDYRATSGYLASNGPTGPGTSFIIPSSNPGFNSFLAQTGQGALIGVAQSIRTNRLRPIAVGGNPTTDGKGGQILKRDYEQMRWSAGLKGEISKNLNFDVAATYIIEDEVQQTPDVLIDRLQRALNGLGGPNCSGNVPGANGCQYFNPFSNGYAGNRPLELTNPGYVPANANSTDLVAWLFDTQRYTAKTQTWVADAVVSGKLPITLPGGDVGFAVGAQYRHVDFNQDVSDIYNANLNPCPVLGDTSCALKTGPYIFLGQNIPLDLDHQVKAVFGELSVPLFDGFNAQLTVRHEDYGGLTGSTTNPQFRAKWDLTDWLSVRGSVGTSFRGPTVGDSAPSGVTLLQGIAASGNVFKSIDTFGNPAVGPEKALSYSVGAILQTGGLTATVDYWSYKVKDQILAVPANVVATAVAGTGNGSQFVNCSSPLRSFVTFNNANACTQGVTTGNDIERVRSDVTNGPTIRLNGIDFDVNYRFDHVLDGTLDIGTTGSYLFHYKQAEFVYNGIFVSPAFDAAGFANYDRKPGTVSKLRASAYLDFETGPHSFNWTTTYIGGVDDNRGPTVVQTGPSTNCSVANVSAGTATNCQLVDFGLRVKSFMMHDFTYRVKLPLDVTLSASVLNVFDRDPPKARLEYSYDPFIGNPIGRTFKIGLRKKF